MAKRTRTTRTDPATDIISGIEHRIELLTMLKAAVRFAFYGIVGPDIEAEDEQPTVTERKAHASTVRKPKAKRRTIPQQNTSALLLEALAKWPGLTIDELYNHLDSRGWRSSSKNPKAVIYQALRNLMAKGKVQRTGTDWELITVQQPAGEEVLGASI